MFAVGVKAKYTTASIGAVTMIAITAEPVDQMFGRHEPRKEYS